MAGTYATNNMCALKNVCDILFIFRKILRYSSYEPA